MRSMPLPTPGDHFGVCKAESHLQQDRLSPTAAPARHPPRRQRPQSPIPGEAESKARGSRTRQAADGHLPFRTASGTRLFRTRVNALKWQKNMVFFYFDTRFSTTFTREFKCALSCRSNTWFSAHQ